MLGGAACHDPRWDILRASALRMDAWWNEEVRQTLTNYIHHVRKEYGHLLVEGDVHKGVSYSDIKCVEKTERQIRSLYFSTETVPAGTGDLVDPFNLVRIIKRLDLFECLC
jgi:hypothetical protein